MSAIFGLIHWDGYPGGCTDAEAMRAALAAHGPDGGGVWKGANVVLGQLLTCFTPEDRLENQPLRSTSGQHIIAANSRLSHREELAEALGIPNPQTVDMPDSMLILRAYEKWGVDCPKRLLGDFVFAIYDLWENQVLLARSPLGKLPLYYHQGTRGFAFGSAPKALFALPWVPRQIDLKGLADYLVTVLSEPGRSLYSQLSRLQAGHSLILRPKGIESRKFWQPDMNREIRFSRDSEYIEAFNDLFARAVSDNLRSITPVSVMMSGGLDSTSVAAVASDQLERAGRRLPAFTEVPSQSLRRVLIKGRYADETPFVRAMAAMYPNIDLRLISADGGFYLDDLDRVFDSSECPFPAASNRVWMEKIMCVASAENSHVLLTGTAGNSTMSWSGRGLLAHMIRSGRMNVAFREVSAIARRHGNRAAFRAFGGSVSSLLPEWAWILLRALRTGDLFPQRQRLKDSPAHPEFLRTQRYEARLRQRGGNLLPRASTATRAWRYETFLFFDILGDIERSFETRYRIQLRDPTADLRLAEFCLSLPEEQFARDGISRRLIRSAMADRLPCEVLENPLRGLQAADWFDRLAGASDRLLYDLARFERSDLVRSVLDLDRLKKLLNDLSYAGSDAGTIFQKYRYTFERGIIAGRFLLWFESGKRPDPPLILSGTA